MTTLCTINFCSYFYFIKSIHCFFPHSLNNNISFHFNSPLISFHQFSALLNSHLNHITIISNSLYIKNLKSFYGLSDSKYAELEKKAMGN